MIYIKTKINEEIEIKIPLYGDQLFSSCPVCGKETQVDEDLLHGIFNDGGDFASTSVYCQPCSDSDQSIHTKG